MPCLKSLTVRIAMAWWLSLSLFAVWPARAETSLDKHSTVISLLHAEAGSRRLILLGEMHGTREIPVFIGELATAFAAEGPLLLALEIDQAQNESLRAYLASDGGQAARKALESETYWHRHSTRNDGRRSRDVLGLIETLRKLKQQGREIAMLAYDPGDVGGSQQRDREMADTLRSAFAAFPRGRLLVLTGNVHAMLERPEFAPPEMQTPMGSYLRDLDPFAVNISAIAGEFWSCSPLCGPTAVRPTRNHSGPLDDAPWQFQVVLPSFTPARLIP